MKPVKKRYVIPIDFSKEQIAILKKEAEKLGLKLSTYVRFLVVTHPNRRGKVKKGGI